MCDIVVVILIRVGEGIASHVLLLVRPVDGFTLLMKTIIGYRAADTIGRPVLDDNNTMASIVTYLVVVKING